MKIRKIAALCKKHKNYIIYTVRTDEGYIQWVGNSESMYVVRGLPFLGAGLLLTIFDVPENKQSNTYVREYDSNENPALSAICFDDAADGECPLEALRVTVGIGDDILIPLRADYGKVYYIKEENITPIDENEELLYYLRTSSDGREQIAVKLGYSLVAVIGPYAVEGQSYIDAMKTMANSFNPDIKDDISTQHTFYIDTETGEAEIKERENN